MSEIKNSILTYSGHYFNFKDMENSKIKIQDIAHGLSNTCRYAGQSPEFYSVAQHSVLVSLIVPTEHALQGLLHDATEAYLGDMVKPLKEMLPQYKEIEDKLERIIFKKFLLPEKLPQCIKNADMSALATEQQQIMNNYDNWFWTGEVLNIQLEPWSNKQSYKAFMRRYYDLTGFPGLE